MIVEIIIICVMLFGICYWGTGTDAKNIQHYSTYPDEVQKIVKKGKLKTMIKEENPIKLFIINTIMFGIILVIFGLFIKEKTFIDNFKNMLILGQILNLFDFVVIDLIWWRNTKRVRFSGTEDKAELYKNPKKHFISFLKGILMFIIIPVINGVLLSI